MSLHIHQAKCDLQLPSFVARSILGDGVGGELLDNNMK